MMYGYGWSTAMGGVLMFAFMIAFMGLFIWVIASAVRPDRARTNRRGALEVLEDRYARGEIDGEEYRTRRSNIEGGV